MSFGAIITVKQGSAYLPMDAELEAALTEIRVEQHLDEPTAFALRFQEDFEGNEPKLTEHPLFKTSTEMAILVPDGPGSINFLCLVQGIVEQVSFDVDIAGAGSAFEVSGRDVRMTLERVSKPESFPSMTSDQVIASLVSPELDLRTCLARGSVLYDSTAGGPAAYNAVGTALEIIADLAEQENHCVWLSYDVVRAHPPITITTTLNVRSSPRRASELLTDCMPPVATPLDTRPEIKLLVGLDQRANVLNFKILSDNERIKSVKAKGLGDSPDADAPIEAKSADDKMNTPGAGVDDTGAETGPQGTASDKPERSAQCTGPGTSAELAAKAEAMATEESWYIEAEAMTSASLYGGVLEPHQEIKVTGAGCEWGGEYQVSDVVHVINGAEHWMTATLRGNSRGKETSS